MKAALFSVLVCTLYFAPRSAHALHDTEILREEKRIFKTQPTITDSRIKEVGFWVQEYKIPFTMEDGGDGTSYGNRFYAWYETEQQTTLKEFVFVQFIKGCRFESYQEDASIKIRFIDSRQFFGKSKLFIHTNWQIDSIDTDPMYWSADATRQDRYSKLRVGGSNEIFPDRPGDAPTLGSATSTSSRAFITDFPDAGSVRFNPWEKRRIATNVSMKFKTCLYRKEDVPLVATPDEVQISSPIVCFFWDNAHVYNHETESMESSSEPSEAVATVCTQEVEDRQ